MYKVRYISEKEQYIHNLVDLDEFVGVIREMFLVMADGDYVMSGRNHNSHGSRISFPRGETEGDGNLFIAMPGYLGGRFSCTGIKWHGPNVAGSSDAETKHLLVINDNKTGVPLGIMPANRITTYRTAAVSVYAASLLADKNIRCIGIIGPGKINTAFLEGIKTRFPAVEAIKIKGRGQESIDRLKSRLMDMYGQKVSIHTAATFQEVVENADIVSINTGFDFAGVKDMPLIRGKWIKPGAVVLCSAYAAFPDSFLTEKAIKVADNLGMYESYGEELGYPVYKELSNLGNRYVDLIREGKISKEDIIEIKDLATGKKTARTSPEDVIVVALGGMAVEDLAVGSHILKKAEKTGAGMMLEW